MSGFQPTQQLIQSDSIGFETESYLRSSTKGSLTATVYSIPDSPALLNNAGRIILNYGNHDSLEAQDVQRYAKQASSYADVRLFSTPESKQRLHSKTYTSIIQGTPTAFISTANLSEGALGRHIDTREERIRSYKKSIFQDNLAFKTTDKSLVSQVSEFQRVVSTGRVPESTRNILVNGQATHAVAHRISSSKRGDRVTVSAPYLNDPMVIASLITAKSQGANVTVISSNPSTNFAAATSVKDQVQNSLDTLAGAGIEVLTPEQDDPLLIHTKAVSIVGETNNLFAIGSHNLTMAAKKGDSVDMMLMLNDSSLARHLSDSLTKTKDLKRYKPSKDIKLSKVETRMSLKGMSGIYKVRSISSPKEDVLPFYPTKLDPSFFRQFLKNESPEVSIYSDLWKSRMGTAVPESIKQMDSEMSDPGLGYQFNKLVGQPIYEVGYGVIGSAVRSVGKLIDTAIGSQAYQDENRERKGYDQGGIKKYVGQAYRDEYGKPDQPGLFEQTLTNFYNIGTGAATTLAFYIGVDLPLKYFRAAMETNYASSLLQLPSEFPNNVVGKVSSNISPHIRHLIFGPGVGGALNRVISDPNTTHSNYTSKLYDEVYNPDIYKKDTNRVARTHDGRLSYIMMGDEGMYEHYSNLRKFDEARFSKLSYPILEAINPYSYGSVHHRQFTEAIDKLQSTVGEQATIAFEPRPDRPEIDRPVFKNLGIDRVQKIAKSYDTVASMLPANLTYWVPPLRRMLKLEQFDPVEHMTIRDVVSFEDAVRWVDYFYKQVGSLVKNPVQNTRQVVKAWKTEVALHKAERELITGVRQSLQKPKFNFEAGQDIAQSLTDLHQYSSSTYKKSADELESLLSDQRVVRYKEQLKAQQILLQESPFRILNDSPTVTSNPFKDMESHAGQRVGSMKRMLGNIGVALLADRIADQFFFQPMGANLLTQIKAHQELESEDGTVARFMFTGDLPKNLVLGIQASAALSIGLLLPEVTDASDYPKSFGHQTNVIQSFHRQAQKMQRQLYKQAGPLHLTEQIDLVEARNSASSEQKRYRSLQSEVHSSKFRRPKLRFNTKAAIAGALVAGFASKTIAMGTAAVMNFIHNKESGVQLAGIDSVFQAHYERMVSEGLSTATTRSDFANLAIGQALSTNFLQSNSNAQKVYSVATQLTTPFFQVPLLIKTDPVKKVANVSVGLQLLPILGAGLTPALPVAIRLSQDEMDMFDQLAQFPNVLTPFQVAAVGARKVLSALTFGGGLVYEKDSTYEQGINFLGMSTAVVLGTERLKGADLPTKLGKHHPLTKHIEDFNKSTKQLRQVFGGALEFSNKSLQFIYSLPIMLGSSTIQGLNRTKPDGGTPKIKNWQRIAAPYYLSLLAGSLISDPDGGYAGDLFSDPSTRVQGAVGVGLLTGFTLHHTGVFDSTETLAKEFVGRVKHQQDYERFLKDWVPKARPNSPITSEIDTLLSTVRELPSQRLLSRLYPSNTLLSTMAAPALWENMHKAATARHLMQISDGNLKQPVNLKLPYAHLKSVGARIGTAALAITALRLGAYSLASIAPDGLLKSLYSVPFLGPTLRLMSGVEPEPSKYDDKTIPTVGIKKGERPGGIGAVLNHITKTLTFGLLSVPKNTGLYSDTVDPFLNLIGPIGASFKQHRTSTYIQYASSFSDVSVSAYDMVSGGISQDMLAQTVGILKRGKAKNIEEALALYRGASARRTNATVDRLNEYELGALSSSSLSRALSVKHYRMQHLSGQRASEQLFDFLKEGYALGRIGHDTIPGFRLPYKGHQPLSTFAHVDLLMQKDAITSGQKKDFDDPYAQSMQWFLQSQWKGRTLSSSYNPFDIMGTGIGQYKSNPWLGAGIFLVMFTASMGFGIELTAKLSTFVSMSEASKLIDSSKLNQGKGLTSSSRYMFTSGLVPGTKKSAVFQVDKLNRYENIYKLPIEVEDVVRVSKSSTFDLVTGITTGYNRMHKNLSSYFSDQYAKDLTGLVADLEKAPSAVERAKLTKAFKLGVQGKVQSVIRRSMQSQLLKGSSLTLYGSIYGGDPKTYAKGVSELLQESRQLLGSSLDEVLEEFSSITGDLSSNERYLKTLRANSIFENSEGLSTLLSKLQEPLPGKFNLGAAREEWSRHLDTELKGLQAGTTQRSRTYKNLRPKFESSQAWSEGFLTTTIKATKGLSSIVASWVATGRSVYELAESASVLFGGSSQSQGLRTTAGQQFVTSSLTWGLAAGAGALAMGLGLGALGAVAFGIGAIFGLDYLKSVSAPIKRFERSITEGLGNLIARPVQSISGLFKPIGLQGVVQTLGNIIATPVSALFSFVSSPFRAFFENVGAPFLQQNAIPSTKESVPMQFLKSFLLPSSIYANFNSYERSSSTYIRDPFIGGNVSLALKQKQISNIQKTISASGHIDNSLVYSNAMGQESNAYEEMVSTKYFSGAGSGGGSRILQPFSLSAYRISQSLRLSLERRQQLFDASVTAAAISRAPEPEDLASLGYIFGVSSVISLHQTDLSQVTYERFKRELSTVSEKAGAVTKALLRPADWLLKKGADIYKQSVDTLSNKLYSVYNPVFSPFKERVNQRFLNAKRAAFSTYSRFESLIKTRLPDLEPFKVKFNTTDKLSFITDAISSASRKVNSSFSKVIEAVKPGERLFGFTDQVSRFARPLIDSVLSTTQSLRSSISNKYSQITTGVKGLYPVTNVLKQVSIQSYESLKSFAKTLLDKQTSASNFFKPAASMNAVVSPIAGMQKSIGRGLRVFTQVAPRQIGRGVDLLSYIPKSAYHLTFFSAVHFISTQVVDDQFKSLDEASTFKEVRNSYQNVGSSYGSYVAGAVTGILTRSPLAAIASALIGGIIGSSLGESISRQVYGKDPNPAMSYVSQTLLTSAALSLMQAPKGLSISRVLTNVAVSAVLTPFLGPLSHLSAAQGVTSLIENRHKLPQALNTAGSVLTNFKNGLNYLFKGQLPADIRIASYQATESLVENFVKQTDDLSQVEVKFKGSRFSITGSYTKSSKEVQLSKLTQRVLGKAQLGHRVNPTDLAEARFTALHELSHASDTIHRMPVMDVSDLSIKEFNSIEGVVYHKRVEDALRRTSAASTLKMAKANPNMSSGLLRSILEEEMTANIKAVRSFVKMYPEDMRALLSSLERSASSYLQTDLQIVLEDRDLLSGLSNEDSGIRFKGSPSKNVRFKVERKIIKDLITSPIRFLNDFRKSSYTSAPSFKISLGEVEPVNFGKLSSAIDLMTTDMKGIPAVIRYPLKGVFGGIGGYLAVSDGSEILARKASNFVKASSNTLEKLFSPIYKAAYQAEGRFAKSGLSLIDLGDSLMIGVDILQGVGSSTNFSKLNKELAQSSRASLYSYKQKITAARNDQLGALLGSVMGVTAGFISKNPLYGFLLGGAAGAVAPLIGFFGLSSKLAEGDLEAAERGEAIYDPIQSPSMYVRLNRGFVYEREITTRALAPLRKFVKSQIGASARLQGKLLKVAYKTLSKFAAIATGLLSSGSALAFPAILGSAALLGKVGYSIGKSVFKGMKIAGRYTASLISFSEFSKIRPALSKILNSTFNLTGRIIKDLKPYLGKMRQFIAQSEQFISKSLSAVSSVNLDYFKNDLLMPALKKAADFTYSLTRTGIQALKSVRLSFPHLSLPNLNLSGLSSGITSIAKTLYRQSVNVLSAMSSFRFSSTGRIKRLVTEGISRAAQGAVIAGKFAAQVSSQLIIQGSKAAASSYRVLSSTLSAVSHTAVSLARPAASFAVNVIKRLSTLANIPSLKPLVSIAVASYQVISKALGTLVRASSHLTSKIPGYLSKLSGLRIPHIPNFLKQLPKTLASAVSSGVQYLSNAKVNISGLVDLTKSGASQVARAANFIGSSALKVGGRILNHSSQFLSRQSDQLVRQIAKFSPKLGQKILSVGYKETALNVIAPALDFLTLGAGMNSALNLNSSSTYAEVEAAYVQMGAAKGSITGSVFGMFAGGFLGDTIGSIAGQIIGEESAKEKALRRYQARDYGLVPVLEDFVQPLLRETALAASLGQATGKVLSSGFSKYARASQLRTTLGHANRLDKIVQSSSALYKTTLGVHVAKAAARFDRVLGYAPSVKRIGRYATKAPGIISGLAKGAFKLLSPVIDTVRLITGYADSTSAKTQAEYEVSIGRTSGAIGSIAGGLIGGALGGPLGAIAGSIVGDFLLDKVGTHLATEAHARKVSAQKVTTGQVVGGVLGTAAGVVGAGLLIAGGVVAGIAAIPLVAIAAGVGLLVGAIAGGYSMLLGSKKEKPTGRIINSAQRRKGSWNKESVIKQSSLTSFNPMRSQLTLDTRDELSEDTLQIRNQAQQKVSSTQEYLSPVVSTPTQSGRLLQSYKDLPHQEKSKQKSWWQSTMDIAGNTLKGVLGAMRSMGEFRDTLLKKAASFAMTTAKKVVEKVTGTEGVSETTTESGAPAGTGKSYLRITQTDKTDKNGLKLLLMQMIDPKGTVKDQINIVSGIRSAQKFRKASQSASGSFEPIPEGVYGLGGVEWAAGAGNMSGNFGTGLGPMWVSINPKVATARAALGIHLDANGPGTAGCVGITNTDDLRKVATWFKQNKPTELVVDYELGSLPGQYKPIKGAGKSEVSTSGAPIQSVKGGVILSSEEAYRLAALAIMEAPSRLGRLDVTQAVFNRINAPKVGAGTYGKNVTGVAFASGQFEPYFGVSASEIKGKDGAIRILQRKRGMSRATAEKELNQYFGDVANPQMMAQAKKHVGGRTDFKGTSEYRNMVKGEDRLRYSGENFFHINGEQTNAELKKLEGMGPVSLRIAGTAAPVSTVQSTSTSKVQLASSKPDTIRSVNTKSSSSSSVGANLSSSIAKSKPISKPATSRVKLPTGKYTVHTQYFIDDSPPGSYDYTLEQNGNFSPAVPSPVRGVITHVGTTGATGGYGNTVAIKDLKTGMEHFMAHLSDKSRGVVKVGQVIEKGQTIAYQGTTGRSSGEHIHHEIWNKPKDQGGYQIRNRSITKPIALQYLSELRAGTMTRTQSSGQTSSSTTHQQTLTTKTTSSTDSRSKVSTPSHSVVSPTVAPEYTGERKRKRSSWTGASLPSMPIVNHQDQLRAGASPELDNSVVHKMVQFTRAIAQNAVATVKPQTAVALKIKVNPSESYRDSRYSTGTTPTHTRNEERSVNVEEDTKIAVSSESMYLRQWVQATGMEVASEYVTATG